MLQPQRGCDQGRNPFRVGDETLIKPRVEATLGSVTQPLRGK